MISPPRPLSLNDRAWIAAFTAACALGTVYFLLLDGILSRRDNLLDQFALPPNAGLGAAFCLMPLSLAVVPVALGRWLFAHYRMARRLIARGDLRGALVAYQRQIEVINRFPIIDRVRGLFFISASASGFREDILLDMAQLYLMLNDSSGATGFLWRCLHYNPHNGEALSLLEQIRRIPQDGIKGW